MQWFSLITLACGGVDVAQRPPGNQGRTSPEGGAAGGATGDGRVPITADAAAGGARTPDAADVSCQLTRPDIEGPFFTPSSPERSSLREAGMLGTALLVRGRVLDAECRPIPNAAIDFWQADVEGAYDNAGFRLRGHQVVDAEGRYELWTIVPGRYLNGSQFRPAHIHVKVYVGQREALTTQLYFEGDPYNDVDPWFDEQTMLRPVSRQGELVADYDFAVS